MLRMTENGLLPQVDVSEEKLESLVAGQAQAVEDRLAQLREAVREIENDDGLTRKGKRERKRELADQFSDVFAEAVNVSELQRLTNRVEDLEKGLYERSPRLDMPDADPDDLRAREREVRDRIRNRLEDPNGDLDLMETLREAARNDEKLLLRAVERDPMPVLDEGKLREVRDIHARQHYPEQVEKLENRRSTVRMLHHNAEQAAEAFQNLTGTSPMEVPMPAFMQESSSVEEDDSIRIADISHSEAEDTSEGGEEPAEASENGAEPAAV